MKFKIDTSIPPTKTVEEIRDQFKKLPEFTKDELTKQRVNILIFRERIKEFLSEVVNKKISETDMKDISENKEMMKIFEKIISGKYSNVILKGDKVR